MPKTLVKQAHDLLILSALVVLGCAGDGERSPCVPGAQMSCACVGGSLSGVQVCEANGRSYGPCLGCAGDIDGGAGDSDGGRIEADAGSPLDAGAVGIGPDGGPRSDGGGSGDGGVVVADGGNVAGWPTCACTPEVVSAHALDGITLAASCASGNSSPLTYRWSVERKPATSATFIRNENQLDGARAWLDAATSNQESYVFRLDATDGLGRVATCRVTAHAPPRQRVYVELTWDHPEANLDLHLLNDRGVAADGGAQGWFSTNDCFMGNRNPAWGVAGTDDDPTFLNDAERGSGPDVLAIDRYLTRGRIGVVYNCAWPLRPITARVRVFCGSNVAQLGPFTLDAVGKLWEAADIEGCTITPTTTVRQTISGCQDGF